MDFPQRLRTRWLALARVEHGDLEYLVHGLEGLRTSIEPAGTPDEAVAHWDRHGYGLWVARDPATDSIIGCGGLLAVPGSGGHGTELVFGLLSPYRGRGFATELARVAVAQGFVRLGIDVIECIVPHALSAARRVAERAGFSYEREVMRRGEPHALYRLTASAWLRAPAQRFAPQSRAAELQTA
jgi:RimJ/RimL family protein N-acetyltransferase